MEYFDVVFNVLCPISNTAVNFPINQVATILRVLRALLHVAVQRNITDAHSAHKDTRAGEGWKSHDAPQIRPPRCKLLPDKLRRKFSALQKRIPSRDSRKLSVYTFCFLFFSSFPRFASVLLSLLLDVSFRSAFPIVASLRVTRTAAFSKIKLSFCGWRV